MPYFCNPENLHFQKLNLSGTIVAISSQTCTARYHSLLIGGIQKAQLLVLPQW